MHALISRASRTNMSASKTRSRDRSASEVVAPGADDLRQPDPAYLPRAASYTYFPHVKELFDDSSLVELKGTISEDELKSTTTALAQTDSPSSGDSSPDTDTPTTDERPSVKRNASRRSSRFLLFSSQDEEPASLDTSDTAQDSQPTTPKARSPVRSMTRLRRKSWISSRPSSPTKEGEKDPAVGDSARPVKSLDAGRRRSIVAATFKLDKDGSKGSRDNSPTPSKRAVISKKPKRPLSALLKGPSPVEIPIPSKVPDVPRLPRSFSSDRLPLGPQSPTSPNQVPPIPRNFSSDKLKGTRIEPRKKDELWSIFRTLEGDLRKFQSKSIALKTNVVRTTLLPFLRAYAVHPSNNKLRPEDLDRRANILNGWWTGLLELLSGRNNLSISGTDRPAILEGIAGIMERPEWRLSPSPFCALANRADTASTLAANSTTSLSSGASDFLAESVYHNVRNIFTQNLLSQMAFVVDKMSLRSAAASLVTFCGKTCAYAFFFCPGIADVLVRLWDPSLDTMRRVLEESGISRRDKLDAVANRVVPVFPPSLHSLKFTSIIKTSRVLRAAANPPLGTANWDWYGPWVKRWTGTESELFYVFVKHYHILVTEFLPAEPTHLERICVPGLVMVHAQILENLDATINRNATATPAEELTNGPAPITFDDVLADPDAAATTVPMPPANATRLMAENRLIMLIRDFLSDRGALHLTARRMFAEAFGHILKAAARKISIYDSQACYTLCDFLEEALVIMVRYDQSAPSQVSVLDWPFWLSVCMQMAASQSTTTELKLYSFLFSMWNLIAIDESRKMDLCLSFLLEPEFFESRFNHWCPMVRTYFMRLLCWRIARYDGEGTEIDTEILKTLNDRLRSVWGHYLWLREDSELKGASPPSTAPCNPAPGRRLLIIRNDNPIVTSGGPFLSFDGVVQNSAVGRLSSLDAISEADSRPPSAQSTDSSEFGTGEEETGKKRWSLLRSFISGTPKSRSKSRSPGPTPKEPVATSPPSKVSTPISSRPSSRNGEKRPPLISHRSYFFRFSLEYVDKRFHRPMEMRLFPPRLPLPAQMHLQDEDIFLPPVTSAKPTGKVAQSSRYAGRSLAEWALVVHECQNFFDRRKTEGVPANKLVETPTLAVENFRMRG
ncbi:DUF1765-domain-containing protein [Lophium mytilinum]|uniref:DUF1765-domain-containing protein n=1 Tax=Lophium mytilinum TaxID=390894 RepID=A0A6A6R770_9PEZI|nr:DUF1765-domain-containing protein [Lophium mytilinum]